MHLQQAGKTPCKRDGCPILFDPKTRWQAFCSVKCRNEKHRTLTPEALHRQIEGLKATVEQLKKDAHPPFDFTEIVTRLDKIEKQVGRLEAIARGEVMP